MIKTKFTGINNFRLIKKIIKKDVYKNDKNFLKNKKKKNMNKLHSYKHDF